MLIKLIILAGFLGLGFLFGIGQDTEAQKYILLMFAVVGALGAIFYDESR